MGIFKQYTPGIDDRIEAGGKGRPFGTPGATQEGVLAEEERKRRVSGVRRKPGSIGSILGATYDAAVKKKSLLGGS